jgi:hypothetical protein
MSKIEIVTYLSTTNKINSSHLMLKPILVKGFIGYIGFFSLFMSLPVYSQIEVTTPQFFEKKNPLVSPLELNQFVQIIQQFPAIDYRAHKLMETAAKKEGLSLERYDEIMKMLRGVDRVDYEIGLQVSPEKYNVQFKVSEEELKKFQRLEAIEEEINEDVVQQKIRIVRSQGLEIKRFQQIESMVARDLELQLKVKQMMGL